jgi:hypothetical protein
MMQLQRYCRGLLVVVPIAGLACNAGDLSEPSTGSLQIVTATVGDQPDMDGYTIQLDDAFPQAIGPNATLELGGVPEGNHTVRLQGLERNCAVSSKNPQTVSITAGSKVILSFRASCPNPLGSLEISTATTGESLDPNGFSVVIDQGYPQQIGVTGSARITGLTPGIHTVSLQDVASNCADAEGLTRSVTVGADSSVTTQFALNCSFIGITTWKSIPLPATIAHAGLPFGGRPLWGTSPSDLFVAGSTSSGGSGIWHYDGVNWQEQAHSDAYVSKLWGFSSTDVYGGSSTGVLLHYDGSNWSSVTGPLPDVWAVASQPPTCYDCQIETGVVLHFDGEAWTVVFSQHADSYHSIWAISPNDVWAVGDDMEEACVVHYDGSRWQRTVPVTSAVTTYGLVDVWGSSSRDVYAINQQGLYHYDGTAWSKLSDVGGTHVWGTSRQNVFILRENEVLYGSP